MLPSILSAQLREMLLDYIDSNFPMSNPFFKDTLRVYLSKESSSPIFHEPYIKIQLPFRIDAEYQNIFTGIEPKFTPYVHQKKAFERLRFDPQSTLIATGTGSGKTECFLYPILDYCFEHSEENGIKAILIYPMNALATDQARRIAKLINDSPKLKDNIEVGLYIGGFTQNSTKFMGSDHVITDHYVLRNRPPSILITNYKMLDFLLLRPEDTVLWEQNKDETLKYLVVDELHTFDGAQATDLACLIRRLKARLKIRNGYLCCVGTSATLGVNDSVTALQNYAEKIFGEPFEDNFLITEDRLSVSELFQNKETTNYTIPDISDMEEINQLSKHEKKNIYLAYLAKVWLGVEINTETIDDPSFRTDLSEILLQHSLCKNIIKFAEVGYFQITDILDQLQIRYRELLDEKIAKKSLYGLLDLISHARIESYGTLRPFLTVSVQLWIRELRRLVSKVADKNEITYSLVHDLNENQAPFYLPMVNCRDCGETAWVSVRKANHNVSIDNYTNFINKYFSYDKSIMLMYPSSKKDNNQNLINTDMYTEMIPMYLCPHCMKILGSKSGDYEEHICPECGKKGIIEVNVCNFAYTNEHKRKAFICPICGSTKGFTLMGWRATTAISTCISHLFASKYNDDKKTLAFSDNVQDAAHLSGFFNFRASRFIIRSAIQRYALDNQHQSLEAFTQGFINYWRSNWSTEEFVSNFTPAEFVYRYEYEHMKTLKKYVEKIPKDDFIDNISRRIKYEIMLEYGLLSNDPRSLVKTNSSLLSFPPSLIKKTALNSKEQIKNELGLFRQENNVSIFENMVIGILHSMRLNGAFKDKEYESFINNKGQPFLLSQKHTYWLPRTHFGVNLPRFPYIPNIHYITSNFDNLQSKKYTGWIRSFIKDKSINPEQCTNIVKIILDELVKNDIIRTFDAVAKIWGLNKEQITVSTNPQEMICKYCGSTISVSSDNVEFWVDAPCLNNLCSGKYQLKDNINKIYFSKLYSDGDLVRPIAHEHTGILKRELREDIEASFKRVINERLAWDYNIITCTPTMEMGIDIGDLSTVILCNVPPGEQQFIQRAGRAGRHDGNSLVVTIAKAVPHDLYFFEEPTEMIKGEIKVPTIFLEAPAVLERQFLAYSMDCWVVKGSKTHHKISSSDLPKTIAKCLYNLDQKDINTFPFNFLNYIKDNILGLTREFVQMFAGNLNQETVTALREYAKESNTNEISLHSKVLEAFHSQKKQLNSMYKNISEIKKTIQILKNGPKDSTIDKQIKQLEVTKKSFEKVRHKIENKNLYNFLSDEGLLPNYAFPESGIILKAVITHKKADNITNRKKNEILEYVRASSSAISELAPSNIFYVDGRKLKIDQVDLSTSEIETWRLCPKCTHAQLDDTAQNIEKCPVCKSPSWADIGQVHKMMKVRLVYSNIENDTSLILDDKDDRTVKYYLKQMLVDVGEKTNNKAYSMNNDDFPFGYEYSKKVTIREINYGLDNYIGGKSTIAGEQMVRNGFRICKYCGKLQHDIHNETHSSTCPTHSGVYDEKSKFIDCLFLYREFQTEALRLLVPSTTIDTSRIRLDSFSAAIMLGLREHFGNVDHLKTCISKLPISNTEYYKYFLVIYDSIPGGTGYLKQLSLDKTKLVEIFEKSLNKLESCICQNDVNKDGCYRCIYAYRQNKNIGQISRKTAIQLLRSIISGKNNLAEIETLNDISVNSLFESELERRFVEALPKVLANNKPFSVEKEFVNGKEGYILHVGQKIWELELQYDFHAGYNTSSRADFILWPKKNCTKNQLPVAIFTDGYNIHQSKVAEDTLKREAIRRYENPKFRVWTLSWNDIETVFNQKNGYASPTLSHESMPNGSEVYSQILNYESNKQYNPRLIMPNNENSLELLSKYLELDNAEQIFRIHAIAFTFSLIESSKDNQIDAFEKWKQNIDRISNSLNISDTEFTFNDYLFGTWKPTNNDSNITIFSAIDKENYTDINDVRYLTVFSLFDDRINQSNDDIDVTLSDNFEKEWNGFWHFFNIMQFLPNFFGVTESGIENYIYSSLDSPQPADPNYETDPWSNVLNKSIYDKKFELVQRLKELGITTIPVLGYELVDNNDTIIASSEMAWENQKVALLLHEQNNFSEIFKNKGWITINLSDDITLQSFQGRLP
ncbi:MAG: DEAD/DEAH box helicase [Endomicrobium sp.]|jgi:DEAD/DEAH box helicase domain-containing protein|nr:DEAD/DEAH box helicase [Endomicrobium sp.]